MRLAILFVAFTAAVAAPVDPTPIGSGDSVRLFKNHGVFLYKYSTTLKVVNPTLLRDDPHTWIKIAGNVRLYFQDSSVEMTILEPKFFQYPSLDTALEVSAELMANLERPIYLSYVEGLVGPIRCDPKEPEWMLNLKKGIINLISVDYLGKDPETGFNEIFTKIEKTIHGICEVTYTMEKLGAEGKETLQYWNVTKSTHTNKCTYTQTEEWNTVFGTPTRHYTSTYLPSEETVNSVTRGLTTQHCKLVASENNFKIIEAHATGIVSYHPFFDKEDDVIVAFAEQSLTLFDEDISSEAHRIDEEMTVTNLIMTVPSIHSMADETSRTLDEKKDVVEYVLAMLDVLSKEIDEDDTPMHEEDSASVLRMVNTVRGCDYKTLEMLYERCMTSDERIVVWFLRLMSMVKTEDSVKLIVDRIRDGSMKMSEALTKTLNEYIFSLSFAGNVTLKMMDIMKEFCSLPTIRASTSLFDTCLATTASMARAYCTYVPTCCPSILELLENPLRDLSDYRSTTETLDSERAYYYLVIAEISEHPALWNHLRKIVETELLPMEIRVRAVLACRPLVRKLNNKIRLPLLKVFRKVDYPEELRLAAFTCLMESPTQSILMASTHHLRQEPSPCVRRFVFEALLSVQETEAYPEAIREVSKTCIDYIISRRLMVSSHRWWFSHFFTKVYKPFPTESISGILHSKLFLTRKSSIPRYLHSTMDVTLLGRKINVFDFEMRLEGLQEMLSKLMGQGAWSSEAEETQKVSPGHKIIDNFSKRIVDIQAADETLKVMTSMKILGNHLSTMSMSWPGGDGILSMLPDGGLQKLVDLEKKFREGYDLTYKKTIMPLEVIVRVPSCAGVPVVFNVTSMMIARTKTTSKLWTTPSLFRVQTFLKGSVDKLNADIKHMHSAVMEVRGGVYFQTPVIECGHRMRKVMNMTMTSTIRADVNKETDSYKFEVDTDSPAAEVFKTKTTWDYFVSLRLPFLKSKGLTCPKVDCTPTPPVVFGCPLTLQLENGALIQKETFNPATLQKVLVTLKVGEGRFLSAKEGEITFSDSPFTWVMQSFGSSKRLFTFFVPSLGYMSVDPVSNKFGLHATQKPFAMRWIRPSSCLLYTLPIISKAESVYLNTIVPFVDHLMSTDQASIKSTKVDANPYEECKETWRPASEFASFLSTPAFEGTKTMLCTGYDSTIQSPSTPAEECPDSASSSLVIPVHPEQIYDLRLVGKHQPEMQLNATVHLRIGNKFLSVEGGKLVSSSKPFEWRVAFYGARRRIASLYANSLGYLSVDPDTSLFLFASAPKLFVVNMLTSEAVVISTLVSSKGKETFMDEYDARMGEELFISVFQSDAVFFPESKYYYEQKKRNPRVKFVVKHLTLRKNAWSLTVHKTAIKMTTVSSVDVALDAVALRHARCWGKDFGVSVCIGGYGPAWSSDSIIRSACSPMMYKIFTKRNANNSPKKLVASITKDSSSSSISKLVWSGKLTLVGTVPERSIDLTTISDTTERSLKVSISHTPGEIELLKFPGFCLELKYAGDNITCRASFDRECKTDHLKMLVTADDRIRRLWMKFEWETSTKAMPSFWIDVLSAVKSYVLVPILRSPWLVFVKPFLVHETPMMITSDSSSGHFAIQLLDMTTAKLEWKMGSEKLIYKNGDLPLPIWGLPIGTKHYPVSRRLAKLTSPVCYYHNTSLYTFDRAHYKYDLNCMDCPHVLVQNCSASVTRFAVTARWTSLSTRSLMIIINQTVVEIEPSADSREIPTVKIDGEVINSLMRDDKYKHMKPMTPKMKVIWESELQNLVFYNYELNLEVTLMSGRFIGTTISPLLFSKICGMCGNMDSDPTNDLVIPAGREIKDWKLFAMNWILPDTDCNKGCPFTLDYITLTSSPQTCTSLATVPQCRPGCLPKEKVEVVVPFRCSTNPEETSIRVSVPNKCDCSTCAV